MTAHALSGSGLHDIGELVFAHELPQDPTMTDCLRAAWDEARWEAHHTYDAWHRDLGRDAYVVYRAAQDRADAAQDVLARIALAQRAQPAL